MGQLKERMTADMRRANYADETVYRYVWQCERFARHYMRSPAKVPPKVPDIFLRQEALTSGR